MNEQEKKPPVSVVQAPFESPVWLFGKNEPEKWLLPRNPASTSIILVPFGNYKDSTTADAGALATTLPFIIAEIIWMSTDAPAAASVAINKEAGLIVNMNKTLDYDKLKDFHKNTESGRVLIYGNILNDIKKDGVEIKIHFPDTVEEVVFSALPLDIPTKIIDILAERKLLNRTPTPAWFSAPKNEDQLDLYTSLLQDLILEILSDKNNNAVKKLDAEFQNGMVDLALDVVGDLPGDQVKLIAFATARFAQRAGVLSEEYRKRIVALLDSISEYQNPSYKLSAMYYAELGEREKSDGRHAKLLEQADGAFKAWLVGVDEERAELAKTIIPRERDSRPAKRKPNTQVAAFMIFFAVTVPVLIMLGSAISSFYHGDRVSGSIIGIVAVVIFVSFYSEVANVARQFGILGKRDSWFKEHGLRVDSEIEGIYTNWGYQINNQPGEIVKSKFKSSETGKNYTFESETLWDDNISREGFRLTKQASESSAITSLSGGDENEEGIASEIHALRMAKRLLGSNKKAIVPVYIHPNGNGKYFMDLENIHEA